MYYAPVDERSKAVHQEDSEHHTFRITGVERANDDSYHTNHEAVDILTYLGASRGHRVGSHEDSTERETAKYEVHIPRRSSHSRSARDIEESSGNATTYKHREHGLPAGHTGNEQEQSAKRNSPNAGLTYRARIEAVHSIEQRHRRAEGVVNLSRSIRSRSELTERRCARESIYQRFAIIPTPSAFRTNKHLIA